MRTRTNDSLSNQTVSEIRARWTALAALREKLREIEMGKPVEAKVKSEPAAHGGKRARKNVEG